jgi:hypothetical protein
MEMYKQCPRKHFLHYNEKLRNDRLPSPLHFGIAIDEALNIVLLQKKKKLTKEEKSLVNKGVLITKVKNSLKQDSFSTDPYEIFDHLFTYYQLERGEEPIDISTHQVVDYYNSDFDPNVLFEEDYKKLEQYIELAGFSNNDDPHDPDVPDPIELYDDIKDEIKEGNKLEIGQHCYYNYCSWLSLRRKGHLIIDAYLKYVMPKIKEVHSIQKKVVLPNESGDEIIGYIDFECEFKGMKGIYTTDNKTSSSRYSEDAVNDIEEKGQLLLYDEFTQHGKAAYIVIMKKMKLIKHKTCLKCGDKTTGREAKCAVKVKVPGKKPGTFKKGRCDGEFDVEVEPYADTQIITSDVDEKKKDLLFEKIDGIMENIENKVIPKNENSCFAYGKKCVYFDYCRSNGQDMTGLKRKVY